MEAVGSSGTLAFSQNTARRNNPEDNRQLEKCFGMSSSASQLATCNVSAAGS
jgi:hypothetical protein